jgi:uncharacterized Tic20 family protein
MVPNLDGKTSAVLIHVLSIFFSFWVPLIFLLVSQDSKVKDHAKMALNWQISFIIYIFVSSILSIILIGLIGFIVFPILSVVFGIIAAMKASEDYTKVWSYPVTIPFLKLDDPAGSTSQTVDAEAKPKTAKDTVKKDKKEEE